MQEVHDSEYAPTYYNNEQCLRYVVNLSYISCVNQFAKIEELPSGNGIADVVFLPQKSSPLPAMVIELKWDKGDECAIGQIHEKRYPRILETYGGEIVLVGINYDTKSKLHSCKIEKLMK